MVDEAQLAMSGTTNLNPRGMGLVELMREDLATHGGDWFSPGFRALAVHRFGNWRMDVEPRVLRAPLSVVYRFLFRRIRRSYGIEIDYSTQIGRRVSIDHQSGIVVNGYCRIGDDCRIRQNVTMGVRRVNIGDCPTLERNVDVGAGAVILGAVTIGENAIIGANAVVLQDVPAGGLAVGVPATIKLRP